MIKKTTAVKLNTSYIKGRGFSNYSFHVWLLISDADTGFSICAKQFQRQCQSGRSHSQRKSNPFSDLTSLTPSLFLKIYSFAGSRATNERREERISVDERLYQKGLNVSLRVSESIRNVNIPSRSNHIIATWRCLWCRTSASNTTKRVLFTLCCPGVTR